MSNTTLVTASHVVIHHIGHEAIDLDTVGLTDVELLKAAAKKFPNGFNFIGSNAGPVWVFPEMLLGLANPDGFGLELQGLGHSAAELIRLAADLDKAEELTGKGVDRMINLFASQAHSQSVAKRPNQLHAARWGASAKVVGADRVAPNTLEYHPDGNVAKRLAKLFGIVPCYVLLNPYEELVGKKMMTLRHPFILGYVVTLVPNEYLTKNLALVNRLDFRKATQGDFDGDQSFLFPIRSAMMANMIHQELQDIIPDNDATAYVLGKPCAEPGGEWWGEVLEKSTEKKLEQSFTKSIKEWIDTHIKMGEYANKFTPFAYRMSDIGSAMAAVGIPGARAAAMIGATIEETFYLGLSGGPKELDEALEVWFKKTMNQKNQDILFTGLRTVVSEDLTSNPDVLTAIARGCAINGERFDDQDPQSLLVHMAFLVGKGKISLPGVMDKLETLAKMAGDKDISHELRDNFLAKMLFHAARKLGQVVGKGNPTFDAPEEDSWGEVEGPDWDNVTQELATANFEE